MKTYLARYLSPAIYLLLTSIPWKAEAAVITWNSSVDLFSGGNNANFVSNREDFIVGFNGGTSSSTQTFGDSVFTATTSAVLSTTGVTGGGVTVTGNFTNQAGPTTFGDGEFTGIGTIFDLLNSAVYDGDQLNLAGLTIGKKYEMQIMVNDARGGTNAGIRDQAWQVGFNDGNGGTTITGLASLTNRPLNDSTSNATAGDYIIGTFIADATTQSFNFGATRSGFSLGDVLSSPNSGQAQFNAFQLRQIPEPTRAVLLGLGFVTLVMRRRR